MTRDELLDLQAGRYLREQAPVIYLLVAANGTITMANGISRQLLGEDVEQKHLRDVFLSFDMPLPDMTTLRDLAADTGKLYSVAMAAGPPESFLFYFMPVGDQTLVLGTANLLEQRQLQLKMLDLNRQFADLTRQLQKSNHQLAALNALKNQFLGMAAHDLRKPVGAILAYSEFLLDEAAAQLGPEHQGFLQIIHDSTATMRQLIDDFLDVSLIEAGKFPLHLTEVDIHQPLVRSLELQRLLAGKRRIRLTIEQLATPLPIVIDEYKIEQVVSNLLANAIEHAPTDSTVRLRILSLQHQVEVQVNDEGPGISKQDQESLFQLYGRGKTQKAKGSRSTGLGLAISQRIIEAHGGAIGVKSSPGQGACFYFILPLQPRLEGETHDTQ